MSQDYNEDLKNNQQDSSQESEYAYKNVIGEKPKKRTWSVVSFVLSLVSLIVCSITPIVGIILGLFSIGCAIFSRKNIGYFDGLSLAGLMIGIFGAVFSLFAILLQNILINFIIGILS